MGKRAAVEMIETIMVLVVVMLLLVIALVFYFRSSAASIQETGSEVCQLSGEDLLVAITAMPEIQCSTDTVAKDCIDIEKVLAFQALLKDSKTRDKYSGYFSGSCPKKVKLELLYPAPEKRGECQPGQQAGQCDTWTVFAPKQQSKSKQSISTPVSIYSRGSHYIGRLVVEINK